MSKKRRKGSVMESTRLVIIILVLFLVLDVSLCVGVFHGSNVKAWKQDRVEYQSNIYFDPSSMVDSLPQFVQELVDYVSWNDGKEDCHYRITDAEGGQWVFYPDEAEPDAFGSQVCEGEELAVWWEEKGDVKIIRAIEGYYDYDEAMADWKSAAVCMAVMLVVSFGITGIAWYCLKRLKRDGETFRRKLPRWLREGI